MAQANTRPPSDTSTPTTPVPASAATSSRSKESKFSVLLDNTEAVEFDRLMIELRALLGHRTTKGDVVRSLIALAADDAPLRTQVVDELRGRPARRHA